MGTQCIKMKCASLQNLQKHKRGTKLYRSKDFEATEAKLVTFQKRLLDIYGLIVIPKVTTKKISKKYVQGKREGY